MRVLVTGASGFAGGWLARACRDAGESVLGVSRSGTVPDGCEGAAIDLRDGAALRTAVRSFSPDVVYHLAALSSVGRSWDDPEETLSANVLGAAALLGAIRAHAPSARVVWVSSSEVYGTVPDPPISERRAPAPESPYAVSKLAGEQLATVEAATRGLTLVVARAFAHAGPGQRPMFLLSNIAWQAVRARRAGDQTLRLRTGNGAVRRDVTDVRDVVRAYRLLAASDLEGVVNVCSGTTRSTAEQVAELARRVPDVAIEHVVDPGLVRAAEVMELRGDPSRLREHTGWAPEIPYAQTVTDVLAHWEREL